MSSPGRPACVLRWLFVATLFVPNLRRLPKPGGNNRHGLLNSHLQGRLRIGRHDGREQGCGFRLTLMTR